MTTTVAKPLISRPLRHRSLLRIILASVLGIVASQASAQTQQPTCDTSVTLTNIYGASYPGFANFALWLTDASGTMVQWRAVDTFASNSSKTVSFTQDDDGNPVNFPAGSYALHIDIWGFGVCCGAFSTYSLTLSDDLIFSTGSRTVSGFLPPGHTSPHTYYFTFDNSGTSCPVLVDPIFYANATSSPQPLDLSTVSTGRVVRGLTADGVTKVLLRIPATSAADRISLRVMSDPDNESFDVDADGGVDNFRGTDFTSELPLVATIVKAQSNPDKYVAYAEYQSPVDFAQVQGTCLGHLCANSIKRTIYIEVERNGSSYSFPIDIARPPVILVHGINSDPAEWNVGQWRQSAGGSGQGVTGFGPFTTFVADYGTPVQGLQTFLPNYGPVQLINSNLGFEHNAKLVAQFIQQSIADYREAGNNRLGQPLAAVQADIVAHSMGGMVTRMIPRSGLRTFKNPGNYEKGTIHKVVTLGTPHLGTPNGRQILMPINFCVAKTMAIVGLVTQAASTLPLGPAAQHPTFIQSAMVNGQSVNGGAFDLGDAVGGQHPSDVWNRLESFGDVPLWVAPIAARAADYQYDSIKDSGTKSLFTYICPGALFVGGADNMLSNYSKAGWKSLLGGESDGVVPLNSGLMGRQPKVFFPLANPSQAFNTFPVAHSSGVIALGFNGPTLHDSPDVANRVTELLNTPRTDDAYVRIP